MKILQVCQPYPPMISGAAIAVAQLAEGLAGKGHEVVVAAASDRREGHKQAYGRLRIERLPSWNNPLRVGQRFLLWPKRRLCALVEDFAPDIVHLHEPLTVGVCGLKAAKRLDTPVVLTLHQLPWFVTKYAEWSTINFEWLLWQYGKWFLSQCAASIVPMSKIAAVVSHHTKHRPHVIPFGANLERFRRNENSDYEDDCLHEKFSLPPGKPVILHTGRLDAEKGVGYVIQAAAKVMREVDAELLVVGDGCQRKSLMKLSEELKIADRCHFTGFLAPDGDLAAAYQVADVFVTASDVETFGIVILEAMAAACPVVAVRATCIPDLVDDKRSGLLVRPKDVDGLAQKIIWLLENPSRAREMGQKGQQISRQYDQETMLRQHLQLYQSLIRLAEPRSCDMMAATRRFW